MLTSIDFDDQAVLVTNESENEVSKRSLSAEFVASESAVAEKAPHDPLGFGELTPKPFRIAPKSWRHRAMRTHLTLTPRTPPRPCGRRPPLPQGERVIRLTLPSPHHPHEPLEQVAAVARAGRGLGVILHREHRLAPQ